MQRWALWIWGALVLACLGLQFSSAAEPEVVWQEGFPLRVGNQVLLLWLPYPGADRYMVVRKDQKSGAEVRWDVKVTQHVDTEAAADGTYVYSVQAILGSGAPGPRSSARILAGIRPLVPPRWSGQNQAGSVIQLVWESIPGAVFYNLYRADAGGASALVASSKETRWSDAAVKPGVSYTYRIRSVGEQGQESKDSEPLQVSVYGPTLATAEGKIEHRFLKTIRVLHEDEKYRLREPTDVAFGTDLLFVTNSNPRAVFVFSAEGEFLYDFGRSPPGYLGEWGIPWGISVTGDKVAVTFLQSSNVRLFSRAGMLLQDFPVAKPKGYENQLPVPQPMDVVLDEDGGFWVSEYTYGQVVHMSAQGKEVGRVGAPRQAKESGPFRSPTFLAYGNGAREVYVVDSLLAEIFALDNVGSIKRRWGRQKTAEGALDLPKGMCVLGNGGLLIADGLRSTLQSFGPDGTAMSVYFSEGKKYLDLQGLVSVALEPRSGDFFAVSKVAGAVYRLRTVQ